MMKGGGRFSHWHTDLRFSATDNSDPQINGRNYRIIITPSLLQILSGPIAFFLMFVGWRYWRSPQTSMKEVIIARALLKRIANWYGLSALLAMYIICLYWVASPSTPLIAPDSGTYWAAKPYRTIGYPLFMWTQYGLFGSLTVHRHCSNNHLHIRLPHSTARPKATEWICSSRRTRNHHPVDIRRLPNNCPLALNRVTVYIAAHLPRGCSGIRILAASPTRQYSARNYRHFGDCSPSGWIVFGRWNGIACHCG